MTSLSKTRMVSLVLVLLLGLVLAVPAAGSAAEAPVNLGTTRSFALLAATTITNNGPTVIDGDAGNDVGLAAGSALTGFTTVTMNGGAQHVADTVAQKAQTDLVTAYNDAAGRAITATIASDLSNTTLDPGVYVGSSGGLLVSANTTLTLDAHGNPDAVFILKSTSDLTLESGAAIRVINGARYCRVFWVVPSSASIGVGAHFLGHLFAVASISVNTNATVQGQLLARTGEISLLSNHITNGLCPTARSLVITKTARDVNGGLLMAGDAIEWTITVTNNGTDPAPNAIVRDTVPSNTHYVSGSITGIGANAANAPNLVWQLGTLAPGAQAVLRFRSTVDAGLPRGTAISNQASAISDTTNIQLSNSPSSPTGGATLLRTGADDRLWLALAAVLLIAAGAFLVVDRRRRLHA